MILESVGFCARRKDCWQPSRHALRSAGSRRHPCNTSLALDQGTTSSRALLFDREGKVCSVAQQEFDQIFPQPGWVEHNPEQIASSQIAVAREALSKARSSA